MCVCAWLGGGGFIIGGNRECCGIGNGGRGEGMGGWRVG